MAVSRNPRDSRQLEQFSQVVTGLSRHDLVLALIPLLLAIPFAVHALVGASLHQSVATGAAVAAVLVADALFIHPPAERSTGQA